MGPLSTVGKHVQDCIQRKLYELYEVSSEKLKIEL